MPTSLYKDFIARIRKEAGKPVRDAFLESYLGHDHPRYAIATPALRVIARTWMREHRDLTPDEFKDVLTELIQGPTSTEKMAAGMLMDYSARHQRAFDPSVFDEWLDHLVGWAEVDAVCTGNFPTTQLSDDWTRWKKVIAKLSGDDNINKRRASLVLFCSPLSRVYDDRLFQEALRRINKLKPEKHILITKAISWLLRSMTRHYQDQVMEYLDEHLQTLPKVAVRETLVKLETGRKTRRRK